MRGASIFTDSEKRVPVRVHQLESVRAIAMHEAEAVRNATVREEEANLVQREEIPLHVGIFQMGCGIPLVDKGRKENRISDEEDRRAHQVPVALVRVELDREATGITHGVRRSRFTADGREAISHLRLLSHRFEQVRLAVLDNVRLRYLEDAKGTATLCVHHAFWDSLAIESLE